MMNKGAFKGIVKKGLAFGMVGAMALSIAACGSSNTTASTAAATEAAQTEAPAATEAPATTESAK